MNYMSQLPDKPLSRIEQYLEYIALNGGVDPVDIEELSVTENGTYTAEEGKAFSPVIVDVPNPSTGSLSITENGTYDVTEKAEAVVNVPSEQPQLFAPIIDTAMNKATWSHNLSNGDFGEITSADLNGTPVTSPLIITQDMEGSILKVISSEENFRDGESTLLLTYVDPQYFETKVTIPDFTSKVTKSHFGIKLEFYNSNNQTSKNNWYGGYEANTSGISIFVKKSEARTVTFTEIVKIMDTDIAKVSIAFGMYQSSKDIDYVAAYAPLSSALILSGTFIAEDIADHTTQTYSFSNKSSASITDFTFVVGHSYTFSFAFS